MTSSTGGGQGSWPFEPSGEDGAAPATPPASPPAAPGSPSSRRELQADEAARRLPPIWLLALIGVLVVGAIVMVVVMLSGRDEPDVPPAQTVTLPVPTPTIDAIEREPGTAFFDALPSQVLQFALTELGDDQELLTGGAIESYRLVYSDGGAATLTLLAGQWRDETGPQARLDGVLEQVTAELGEVPEAGDVDAAAQADDADGTAGTPTDDAGPAPAPVQGPVKVGEQVVGRYVFVPREDGTGTLWWTNSTVFLQLDGPSAALRDVFKAFPL